MTQADRPKDIFSTHDAARVCRVTPMTVIRWIKDGKIPAFRTAGGHRRILVDDLARFCAARGIPFAGGEHGEAGRVLIADADPIVREVLADAVRAVDVRFAIELAADAFTAGRLLASFHPGLFLVEQRLAGLDALDLCARLTRGAAEPIAVGVLLADGPPDVERAFKSRGAVGCIAKPPVPAVIQRLVRTAFQLPEVVSTSTIYVLDKDGRGVRALRRDLEARLAGSRVFVFDCAVDLLFAVASEPPDAIIVDVGALDMSGVELVRRLVSRATVAAPLNVVAVASGRDGQSAPALLNAGARAVLTKPVVVDELLASLRGGTGKRERPRR